MGSPPYRLRRADSPVNISQIFKSSYQFTNGELKKTLQQVKRLRLIFTAMTKRKATVESKAEELEMEESSSADSDSDTVKDPLVPVDPKRLSFD